MKPIPLLTTLFFTLFLGLPTLHAMEGSSSSSQNIHLYFGPQGKILISAESLTPEEFKISEYFKNLSPWEFKDRNKYVFDKEIPEAAIHLVIDYFRNYGKEKKEEKEGQKGQEGQANVEKKIRDNSNILWVYSIADQLQITPLLSFIEDNLPKDLLKQTSFENLEKLVGKRAERLIKSPRFFDWEKPRIIKPSSPVWSAFIGIALSKDGKYIAYAPYNKSVETYDLEGNSLLFPPTVTCPSIRFHSDDLLVTCSSATRYALSENLPTKKDLLSLVSISKKEVLTFEMPQKYYSPIFADDQGNHYYSTTNQQGSLEIKNLKDNKIQWTLPNVNRIPDNLQLSSNKKYLLINRNEIFNLETKQKIYALTENEKLFEDVEIILSNTSTYFIKKLKMSAELFRLNDAPNRLGIMKLGSGNRIIDIGFSPLDTYCILTGRTGTADIYYIDPNKPDTSHSIYTYTPSQPKQVALVFAFSNDEKYVAIAIGTKFVIIDLERKKEIASHTEADFITQLRFIDDMLHFGVLLDNADYYVYSLPKPTIEAEKKEETVETKEEPTTTTRKRKESTLEKQPIKYRNILEEDEEKEEDDEVLE